MDKLHSIDTDLNLITIPKTSVCQIFTWGNKSQALLE